MNQALRLLLSAAFGMLLSIFHLHSQTCTGNLLTNPGFESGLTGWTTTGNVTTITTAHAGTKAAHVGGSGYASIGQVLPTTPGTVYTLKAWSKYTGNTGYKAVELRFLNAAWTKISTVPIYSVITASYSECTLSGTAPVGAAYVYALAAKDGTGSIDVDDFCLTSGPACSITANVSNIVCDDNGTPNNPADDKYSFTLNATSPYLYQGYHVNIPETGQSYSGVYGSPHTIYDIPIAAGTLTLSITDVPPGYNCSTTLSVAPPTPCSQCAAFNWSNELSGTGYETFRSVASYADGSYIGVGHVESDDGDFQPTQGVDMFVVRYGPTGIEMWLKQFGGEGWDQASDVIALSDGGALVVGFTHSYNGFGAGQQGGGDAFALRLDASGNQVWKKFYGGSSDDRFYSAIQLPGGDYAFSGVSYSNNGDVSGNQGDGDGWLIRVSSSGTIIWSKLYGNSLHQNLEDIKLGQGNTLAASGLQYVAGAIPAAYQAVAVETSLNGNLNWLKTYTTQTNDVGISLLPNDIGGYLFVLSLNERPAVARLDASGNILQSWNLSEVWGLVEDAVKLPGNKIAIAGTHLGLAGMQESDPASYDFWLVVLDGNGNWIYNKTFGEHRSEGANCINVTPDGGYLLGGYLENSFGSQTFDAWVVKFGADPCLQSATCNITATVSNIVCNDNGTPNIPNEDKFSFDLTVNNTAISSGFQVSMPYPGQPTSGTYGSVLHFQNLPISALNLYIDLVDNQNSSCTKQVVVAAPPPCSNGGGTLPDFILNSILAVKTGGGQIHPNDQVMAGTAIGFPDHFAWLDFPMLLPDFTIAIKAYLSTDMTLDGNDLLLASDTRLISQAVQSYFFTEGSFGGGTIPATTQPGNYFIIVKYDADNAKVETNEANNLKNLPIVVTAPGGSGIDLELSMQQNAANPVIYSTYTTTLTLVNKGPQAATGVKVKWLKPAGVVYTGGNEFVASQGSFNPNGDQIWTAGNVPANGSATLRVSYFLLQNGAPVTYAQVSATNETDVDSQPNNGTPPTPNQDDEAATGGSQPPAVIPDLTIADLQIPNASVAAGSILNYNFDASNIGTATATGNFTIKSYISTDNVLSANDIQDGTIPTGNYGVGFVANNVPGASTIAAGLAPGNYFLIVKIDADNVFVESNENNNMIVAAFTVTAVGGDLPDLWAFTGGIFFPDHFDYANPGEVIQVIMNVQNSGTASAGSFKVKFYFSTDNILSNNDVLWVTKTVPFLAYVGSSGYSGPAIVTVSDPTPTSLALGNYYLIVSVDADNEVAESDESNNSWASGNIRIGAPNNPCDAIAITPAPGQITVAGATAPHVLIKVFRPNWTVAFECLDNCANPLVVNGLPDGTYHVQVKLIDNSWGTICYLERDVALNSFGGGNGSSIAKQDDRLSLTFEKVYPNPSSYQVFLDLFSPTEQSATLDFYDMQGRFVHTMDVQLDKGVNTLEVMVYDWKSGSYNVIARGEESALPAYGRLMKVWEE